MADKVRMIAPLLTVLMDDGAVFEIQATNYDMLTWERTRQRKLGTPQEAQIGWTTFLAWHGLHREGQTDMSEDVFERHCVSVVPVAVETDPTNPVPGAG